MSITLGKRSFESINKYMLKEFAVAYNCLAMSCVLRDMGLENCADWVLIKSEDNRQRALKVLHHFEDRSTKFKLVPIPVSRQDWRAPLHIFEEIYRNEQELSGLVSATYESALLDKDYVTQRFIAGFFDEQLKSELVASNLLNKLRKMQSSDIGVFEFDRELKSIN